MGELSNHGEQVVKITREVTCDEVGNWSLDYYLETYTSTSNEKFFGVKVCKRIGEEIIEERETFAITECRVQASAILEYLANGTVTPFVLVEMVDEWFSNDVWSPAEIVDEPPPNEQKSHKEV